MEFHKRDAIYLQIADIICENILTASWAENERIPSVREMAIDLEVNPNTAMRAYAYLQEKEIIFNRRGIGYFVAKGARKTTRALMKSNFIKNDLPRVFRSMALLEMNLDELKAIHGAFSEKEK